ncbi:glutathione peroxidase [Cytobacillus sp. IB215665]|uniref:glutathione peroxidase n=1 Tax=Cytobacillus sp. IB215665 TaxID=3097357 RepID=UPI002A141015|nr:glutathione peroxidase [Cytobacillus sp. IB215665]MDX8366529.1 glutathione peroxidase [Cytobacillus sp. IB215665]
MSIYEFSASTIKGEAKSLHDYEGQVVLVVNTASKCGFTPQYKQLEELYKTYKDKGLVVLGFPCDQFGNQEPGANEEIESFCEINYGVTFPMFSKVDVNGENAHPLFTYLKEEAPGILGSKGVKWNFTKFLIDKGGKPVSRFAPKVEPSAIKDNIEQLLK